MEVLPSLIVLCFIIFRFRKFKATGCPLGKQLRNIFTKPGEGAKQRSSDPVKQSPLHFGNWSAAHKILIVLSLFSPLGLALIESHRLSCQTFEIGNWMLINILFMLCGATIMAPSLWMKVGICIEGAALIVFINSHQLSICRQYPAGAFGFLLLGVVAILTVITLRRQSIAGLHSILQDLAANNSEGNDFFSAIVQRREKIVSAVEEYFGGIVGGQYEWSEVLFQARILKTIIRNFLVASEYFDIPLHIELYDILEERSKYGAISRMEILGSPPTSMNKYFNYRKYIELIKLIDVRESMLLVIVYERNPQINIYASERVYDSIDIDSAISGEVFDFSFHIATADQLS
jgi:hypothetical protein